MKPRGRPNATHRFCRSTGIRASLAPSAGRRCAASYSAGDSLFQQIVRDNAERPAVIEFNRTLTSRELSELVGRIVGTFPAYDPRAILGKQNCPRAVLCPRSALSDYSLPYLATLCRSRI